KSSSEENVGRWVHLCQTSTSSKAWMNGMTRLHYANAFSDDPELRQHIKAWKVDERWEIEVMGINNVNAAKPKAGRSAIKICSEPYAEDEMQSEDNIPRAYRFFNL
ncbi:MAG: hypothetical protein ACKO12_05555, partial [Actinomycetota bacterium]